MNDRRYTFLFILLALVFGCTENQERETLLLPENVDFGKVRSGDSPVHTSFQIINKSSYPIKFSKTISGCGCTVVDLKGKVIQPDETLDVPVKINITGRKGDFFNDILLESEADNCWVLQVRGKIIDDIWYDGQPIQLHVGEEKKVSTNFYVYTVDYSDIQFDFNQTDTNIMISERSRSVKNGETAILLNAEIRVDKKTEMSTCIEVRPINADVPPLTIPVYLHNVTQEQKIWGTTHINLGKVKRSQNIAAKIYADTAFLRQVDEIQPINFQENGCVKIESYIIPAANVDYLELVASISTSAPLGVISGNFLLQTSDQQEMAVHVSGLVIDD